MKLGIIGGSGLENPEILKEAEEINVDTPYGNPSSSIISGNINDIGVCIISRHGRKHEFPPSQVNYRANIFALKSLGCTHIIATSACGSLREEIKRGDFVIIDDFIDYTKHRKTTFYESFEGEPKHTPMINVFSEYLRNKIIKSCKRLNFPIHEKGTVITIEGPRFSTKAESLMFRSFGADVINMSIASEAVLAKEAGLEYAVIAMSTDYDVWKNDEEPVSWQAILEIFNKNVEKVKGLILETIKEISLDNETEKCEIRNKIRAVPDWPKKGIIFRDVTTLIKDNESFEKTIGILEKRYKEMNIDLIAGIESRGFIFGSALASRLKKGFILIRKPGKLPAETLKEEYELEYGKDAVEIHKDAIMPGQNILLIDDLIATGGTVKAAGNLIERLGGNVVECGFIIELLDLKGREKLKWPVYSVVEFEGE
jgi:5'-methylthioadenosine phosphorylase